MSTGRKFAIAATIGLWSLISYALVWLVVSWLFDVPTDILTGPGSETASRWNDVLIFGVYNIIFSALFLWNIGEMTKKICVVVIGVSLSLFSLGVYLQASQGVVYNASLSTNVVFCYFLSILFVTLLSIAMHCVKERKLSILFNYWLEMVFQANFIVALAFALGFGLVAGMGFGCFLFCCFAVSGVLGFGAGIFVGAFVKYLIKFILWLHKVAFGRK